MPFIIDWQAQLASAVAKAAGVDEKTAMRSLMAPSVPICDWCSNLAFLLAKEKKTAPQKLAEEWANSGNWPEFVSKAQAAGAYLNFHFSSSFWHSMIYYAATEKSWGLLAKIPLKVLIEFPSVNPNKPWHVGHLRNAILGDSTARLLSCAGRTVERLDYIDDLGLQVAQSVWGINKFSKSQMPANLPFADKFDHQLGWQYVEVAKQAQDPEIEKQIRHILKQMEEGDNPIALSARELAEKCVKAQYHTAFLFGIYHDVLIFESDIVRSIFNEGMQKIMESGAVEKETEGKNAGCIVAKLSGQPEFKGMENADKVLIRSDQTATYTGKDVVFALWKFGLLSDRLAYAPFMVQPNSQTAYMSANSKLHSSQAHLPNSYICPMPFGRAQMVINVIGSEQAYPQKVISAIMRKMNYSKQADSFIHLAYEHVVLPEGRFSGRKGTWMGKENSLGFTADELLEEMRKMAKAKIKDEGYTEEEKEAIAFDVAVAAIRFWFLRPSAAQKIVFDYEKALSFSGDSGPYILYAYARAGRILEKAKDEGIAPALPSADYKLNEKEIGLARLLMRWEQVLENAANGLQVHSIADFTLEAAGKFNEFYTTTPVLAKDVPDADKAFRVAEVAAARALIARGMEILGLPKINRM
jgi:arginyl-tRNA synthetase